MIMVNKDLQELLSMYEKDLEKLRLEKEEIDHKLHVIYDQVCKIRNEIDKTKLNEMGENIDWEFLLKEDTTTSNIHYKTRQKILNDIGLHSSGEYFPEISQVCVKVHLFRKDKGSLEKTIKALETILPFIKPLIFSPGEYKRIGVSEHTLGAHGIYEICVDEKQFHLSKTSYGQFRIEKTFDSLRSILEYVQDHHWDSDSSEEDNCLEKED